MKSKFWIYFCLLVSALNALSQQPVETTTVDVQGMGINAEAAETNALYSAVKQAVGTYLDEETMIKNDAIVREKLLSVAKGFVESYKVVELAKQRVDGSGLWDIKIKAVVRKSEVGAALRLNGVMQVSADGRSGWAQEVTKMKNRDDAMALLQKFIPLYCKNIACGRIIQSGQEVKTTEDVKTGKMLTQVQIEFNINMEWWTKEAYPALDAALTALQLEAKPAVVRTLENLRKDRFKDGWYMFRNPYTEPEPSIRLYSPADSSRMTWTVKEFYLPEDYTTAIYQLITTSYGKDDNHSQTQNLFTVHFLNSEGATLYQTTVNDKISVEASHDNESDAFDRLTFDRLTFFSGHRGMHAHRDVIALIPAYGKLKLGLLDNERKHIVSGYKLWVNSFIITYSFDAPMESVKNTRALKLLPLTFGVIDKPRNPVTPPKVVDSARAISPLNQRFVTVEDAKREAIRLYPDLSIAESALNKAFVTRVNAYQKERPEYFRDNAWPLQLVEELTNAREQTPVKPKAAPTVPTQRRSPQQGTSSPQILPPSRGGLQPTRGL